MGAGEFIEVRASPPTPLLKERGVMHVRLLKNRPPSLSGEGGRGMRPLKTRN